MRTRLLAAFAALVVGLTACGSDAGDQTVGSASPAAGQADAQLLQGIVPTVSGDDVDLASYAGQDVILWFWAPW